MSEYSALSSLRSACERGDLALAEQCLNEGVPANAVFDDGLSPLHVAAAKKQMEVCRQLVAHGADIDFKSATGKRPIDCTEDVAVQGALLKLGARIDPWEHLARRMLCQISGLGQDTPQNTEIVLELLSRGVSGHARDTLGDPAYHLAAGQGRITWCDAMRRHGVSIDATDERGWTSLHHAATAGFEQFIAHQVREGADVNAVNIKGETPLHVAVWNKHADATYTLLAKGADFTLRDGGGCTPVDLAVKRRWWPLVHACLAVAPDFDEAAQFIGPKARFASDSFELPKNRLAAAVWTADHGIVMAALDRCEQENPAVVEMTRQAKAAMKEARDSFDNWGTVKGLLLDRNEEIIQVWLRQYAARKAISELEVVDPGAQPRSDFGMP